jgi:hypothetical protein
MEINTAEAEIVLKKKISQSTSFVVERIQRQLGGLEQEYVQAVRNQRLGIVLLALAPVLPISLLWFETSSLWDAVFIAVYIFAIVCAFRFFLSQSGVIRKYHAQVDRIIFAEVFSLLGLAGKVLEEGTTLNTASFKEEGYKSWFQSLKSFTPQKSVSEVIALAELDKSELITETHNTNRVGNVFEINYRSSLLRVAELDIKHVSGSGSHSHNKNIFHGYIISFVLNRHFEGKTFVSADTDKSGFGNLSAFGGGTEDSPTETLLEWNDFESLLHVATTNEAEARYILTPDFMLALYEWWSKEKGNVRLSFINNQLYILYPDSNIRLNHTIKKITHEQIAEYLFTIAWPLQNVIKLIDDIRL